MDPMSRGFVIIAENTDTVDYVRCANLLVKSLKNVMPNEKVALLTDNVNNPNISKLYDYVIQLEDVTGLISNINTEWKLYNDFQVYKLTPFTETIKIEADMYIPRSISHWFDICKHNDVVVCNTIRNFKGNISTETFYRETIVNNNLPNTYNAITYFKKSEVAKEFFDIVKDIFSNWEDYKSTIVSDKREEVTTDVVYSMASAIIGVEKTTLLNTDISFIHMKTVINNNKSEEWIEEYTTEIYPDVMRINTHPVLYPLHYHIKTFPEHYDRIQTIL